MDPPTLYAALTRWLPLAHALDRVNKPLPPPVDAMARRTPLDSAALDALELALVEAGFEAQELLRPLLPVLAQVSAELAGRLELSLRRYEHETALGLLRELRQRLGT